MRDRQVWISVLHFTHGDGQAQTRSTTDDVGRDDRLAGGRKPPVLSAPESAAARPRVRRFRRRAMRWLLCGDDGSAGLPPGIYFRLLLIGYFEGIDAERGIAWRAANSLAL